ncbi:hypothetical protein IOD13_01805 [Brevibacterium casei]|nr:hypothetical protein [Brevibacterium casei]
MSSPHHPTGPGAPQWRDQPGPHPGPNSQPPAGGQYGQGPGGQAPGGQYGQGPGGQAPGGQYGQGPGPYGPDAQGGRPTPYGSGPGPYGSGPAQYGSGPGPYGSGPGQYGQAPGQYGSGPSQYGSGPGPYGSGPGQFGSGPAPRRPRRTGPGLVGPLTLRDLFLLFAGLLALIVLFVPYKNYDIITMPLWSWNIDSMGTLVFVVLAILLIVGAVLMNKFGNGRMRVGSLGLDQFISVLSSVAFAFAFVQLITSAPYWSVGAYLAFFAALIAFFAGVFTMPPFFAAEFAGREDVPAHAKARPVTKTAQHPAPQAHVPGGFDGGYGGGPHPGAQGPQGQGGPGGSARASTGRPRPVRAARASTAPRRAASASPATIRHSPTGDPTSPRTTQGGRVDRASRPRPAGTPTPMMRAARSPVEPRARRPPSPRRPRTAPPAPMTPRDSRCRARDPGRRTSATSIRGTRGIRRASRRRPSGWAPNPRSPRGRRPPRPPSRLRRHRPRHRRPMLTTRLRHVATGPLVTAVPTPRPRRPTPMTPWRSAGPSSRAARPRPRRRPSPRSPSAAADAIPHPSPPRRPRPRPAPRHRIPRHGRDRARSRGPAR